MTQQEWDLATEEERLAEMERCRKDSHYFYITYYWKEGMKTYTKEDWDKIQGFIVTSNRRIRRFNPMLQDKIEWTKPKENKSPYDGDRVNRFWDTDPDNPWDIPIRLAFENPELYQKLIDQRNANLKAWQKAYPLKLDVQGKVIFTSLFDDDKNSRAFRELWDANSIPGYKIKTEFDTEDEAKEHFGRLTKLQRYFVPSWIKKEKE